MTDADGNQPLKLDASTRLAVERTRLAFDSSLLAWIRSAISLITFGYGIYKVIENGNLNTAAIIGHRTFGLIMIGIGLLALILGTLEHLLGMKRMNTEYPNTWHPFSYVWVLSVSVAVFGLLAMFALTYRA